MYANRCSKRCVSKAFKVESDQIIEHNVTLIRIQVSTFMEKRVKKEYMMENGKEELYNEQKMACVHKKTAQTQTKEDIREYEMNLSRTHTHNSQICKR